MPSEATVSGVAAVINDVSLEIGEWAEEKGFREDWKMADRLEGIAHMLDKQDAGNIMIDSLTVSEHLWAAAQALRTNILGCKLMLIVTEAAEAMESVREVGAEGVMQRDGNVGEELADILVRVGELSHMIKSPLGDETVRKMDKNADRPYKHGKTC